jgi:hypothetical protein
MSLSDDFDRLAETALRIKWDRDELLEAAKAIHAWIEADGAPDMGAVELTARGIVAWSALRAAIAKAEGGQD